MLKNKYEIEGNTVKVYINKTNGKELITYFDLDDLKIISDINSSICARYNKDVKNYYAYFSKNMENRLLNRFIMDAPKGLVVDHINHNTLDNRKNNLRVIGESLNQLNREKAQVNNQSSGVQGVTWDKRRKKWKARIRYKGSAIYEKHFEDLNEAKVHVEMERAKLFT